MRTLALVADDSEPISRVDEGGHRDERNIPKSGSWAGTGRVEKYN
jgi:hypothetical protein